MRFDYSILALLIAGAQSIWLRIIEAARNVGEQIAALRAQRKELDQPDEHESPEQPEYPDVDALRAQGWEEDDIADLLHMRGFDTAAGYSYAGRDDRNPYDPLDAVPQPAGGPDHAKRDDARDNDLDMDFDF